MIIKNELSVKKNFNVGISILRVLLCFWVVVHHCANAKMNNHKYLQRNFHVPTFFLLSFYFYYSVINKRNILKIKFRFQRLLYPYILWPLLILLFNNALVASSMCKHFRRNYTMKDLYIQILIGARFYTNFWFHFNLILLSLFITIISFIAKAKLLIIYEFIGIISLYLHVSGINNYIFYNLKSPTNKTLGCINEMIPLSVFGCFFSSINLLLKLNNLDLSFVIIFFLLLYLIFEYEIFFKYPGILYPNVLLNVLAATILILLFGSININNFENINKLLKYVTSFTGGIYYLHQIFPDYLYHIFNIDREKTTYLSPFAIYIICYIICFLGNKLFKNNKFKYLFM